MGSFSAFTVTLGGALPVHKQTLVPGKTLIENELSFPVSQGRSVAGKT